MAELSKQPKIDWSEIKRVYGQQLRFLFEISFISIHAVYFFNGLHEWVYFRMQLQQPQSINHFSNDSLLLLLIVFCLCHPFSVIFLMRFFLISVAIASQRSQLHSGFEFELRNRISIIIIKLMHLNDAVKSKNDQIKNSMGNKFCFFIIIRIQKGITANRNNINYKI